MVKKNGVILQWCNVQGQEDVEIYNTVFDLFLLLLALLALFKFVWLESLKSDLFQGNSDSAPDFWELFSFLFPFNKSR